MNENEALDLFRREFPQPASNFEADVELIHDQKQKFIAHLRSYSTGRYQDYLNNFLYDSTNQQHGSDVTLGADEKIGAVRSLPAFASRFVDWDVFDHDPYNAEAFVRDLSLLPAGQVSATLNALFPAHATVTAFLMWSYRNADPTDPFFDIDVNDLPCRLALPSYGVSEHIAFAHSTHNRTSVPTFFDAGLSNEWRPGGKTHPLPPCASKYAEGLSEIVHSPTLFRDISSELHII